MRLDKITIENFRGIEKVTFRLRDYTTLIGPNNAGKSSILRAIEMFLDNKKPTLEDWPGMEYSKHITITGHFVDLSAEEKKSPAASGLLDANGEIQLRYVAVAKREKTEIKVAAPEYAAYRESEIFDGLEGGWSKKKGPAADFAKKLGIQNADEFKKRLPELQQALRDNGHAHKQAAAWTDDGISFANALQQVLPRPILVPAIREAADEAGATKESTAFGKLFAEVLMPALQATEEFKQYDTAAGLLSSVVNGTTNLAAVVKLQDALTDRMSSLIPAKARFQVSQPDLGRVLSAAVEVRLISGIETSIEQQGHGLQRALIFALLEEFAKLPNSDSGRRRPVVLLFEEPELFLHPHLMRKLRDTLKEVGARPDWQVLTTTHSPFLIEVGDDPTSLVLLRRKAPEAPVVLTQLKEDPFATTGDATRSATLKRQQERLRAALDFHPTVCEAFFASHAVLVEGDSEVAILSHGPRLWQAFGLDEKACREVTVVNCAGKWTIPGIGRLLGLLGVPYRVVHDRDPLSEAEQLDKPGFHPFFANEEIAEVVGDSTRVLVHESGLENELGIKLGGKGKPLAAWLWTRDLLDEKKAGSMLGLKRFIDFAFTGRKEEGVNTPAGVA